VWRSPAGLWLWKCHAGCGEGDEITFLEKYKRISKSDAISLFKQMAGVTLSPANSVSLPNWKACVEAFTETHLEHLADWRGLSGEFCSWLKQNRLVGLFENCIAFPVQDAAHDQIAAIHYRLADGSWRYFPKGAKVRPLIIGEIAAGETLHVFESQWDAFAFMDKSGERSGIVISRGAGNGALIAGSFQEDSTVYLWSQNDAAGQNWAKNVCANSKAIVKIAKIPEPHKDLNDWTRAGATTNDLIGAMISSQLSGQENSTVEAGLTTVVRESEPGKENDIQGFPIECLPPLLKRQACGITELCGVPLSMSAPMVLATASIAIGRGLQVRSLSGRVTHANLFVLVCKTSGSGGSLTFKHATAPLVGMQKTLRLEFETQQRPRIEAEYTAVLSEIDEQKRRLRNPAVGTRDELVEKLTELNAKRMKLEKQRKGRLLYVTDITSEKLAELLAEHGETLGHIDSDAGDALGLITGARYGGNEKHTSDSLWLKSYSGEPIVIFRKNSEPQHLTSPCMAVLFLATPSKVQELFKDSRLTSGGLLPRFLACDPMARPVPVTADHAPGTHKLPTDISQPYESAIFAVLNRYRFLTEDDEISEIDMTSGARKFIYDDWNRFCSKCSDNEDHPFEARHTENAIRIAVVLHTFRCIHQAQESQGTFHSELYAHASNLDGDTMQDALQIRDWFNEHQERLRAPERSAAEDGAWHKVQVMMRERPVTGITTRDLYNNRKVCATAEQAERLLKQWKSEGRIQSFDRKTTDKGGRPTIAYRLTPLSRY
jgi:hypothetical protein